MLLADQFYYLNNFKAMIEALGRRDGDLLDAEECEFIQIFSRLPKRAAALLVRMVMRKGSLFRASRLNYPEIACIATAIRPLIEQRWVDDRPALLLDDFFKLLTKAEVADHLSLAREQACRPKATLLETLRPRFPTACRFDEWCAVQSDTVYKLIVDPLCERLRLMFFGNFRQHWSEFVLKDLGVFRFEKIVLRPESRPFACRRQVEDFHRLYQCRQMLHDGKPPADVQAALPAPVQDCEWLENRRQKLRFSLGRAYERAGAREQAAAIYADCSCPDAATRLSLLERRRARRGSRNPSAAAGSDIPVFDLTLPVPEQPLAVERLVSEHLVASAAEPTAVHHVENALINSLFGLLCWTAIFAPIPGAFFHDYHHGPADLACHGFRERRASHFAECLVLLESGAYRERILRHFLEKTGIISPFVAWGLLDLPLLETALSCFPAAHLGAWFDWIARDVCANRTGFPDLVQFWPQSRRYRLIEVKGPGDRLQANQRRCLEFSVSRSLPVSVCRVSYASPRQAAESTS